MSNAGKPKPAFFIAALAIAAGLVGLSLYRCNAKKSSDKPAATKQVDLDQIKQQSGQGIQ